MKAKFVMVIASLAVVLAVGGCASSHQAKSDSFTVPAAVACESLVGKRLPASAQENGCSVGNTIRVVVTYTCEDGSEVIAFPGNKVDTYYWAVPGGLVMQDDWTMGNLAATSC